MQQHRHHPHQHRAQRTKTYGRAEEHPLRVEWLKNLVMQGMFLRALDGDRMQHGYITKRRLVGGGALNVHKCPQCGVLFVTYCGHLADLMRWGCGKYGSWR